MIEDKTVFADALYFATNVIEGQELKDLAVLCGYIGDNVDLQRASVIEFAMAKPAKVQALADAPDMKIRALIERAKSKRIIKSKGSILIWASPTGDLTLGADYSEAISKLMKDTDTFGAIEKHLSRK